MSTGSPTNAADLRRRLVEIALQWQECFGVAPAITSVVSELDAARLVGMPDDEYCAGGADRTFVTKRLRFQIQGLPIPSKGQSPERQAGIPCDASSEGTQLRLGQTDLDTLRPEIRASGSVGMERGRLSESL